MQDDRFKVRIEVDRGDGQIDLIWLRGLRSLDGAQRAYVDLRNNLEFGASAISEGQVFNQYGEHVGRISYNGRLWRPTPWKPGDAPLAEAPT